jgi:hypothetical protein
MSTERVNVEAVLDGAPVDSATVQAMAEEIVALRARLHELATLQDRIPDNGNGEWGLGYDQGYNAAYGEVRAIAQGGGL